MAVLNRVVLNNGAIREMLVGPAGPVTRDLLVRAERVKAEAIKLAPVGKPDPLGRDKVPPGNLRDHIVKRVVKNAKGGPAVQVGVAGVPYAIFVHEGAPAHTIVARNAPLLVFFWEKAGGVVAFPRVRHPGNKPNRFLIRALRAARG